MTAPAHVAACCTSAPFESNYTPKGVYETISDLPVYFVGEKGKPAIMVAYDIFGLTPNSLQFADTLATHGFRVAVPDYYHGNPWVKVPIVMEELFAHLGKHAPTEAVHRDSRLIAAHLRSEGASKVGAVGQCWGGKIVCELAAMDDVVDAVASVHPAQITEAVVSAIKVPVAFLPSKDEPDFLPFFELLSKKPFGPRNIHHRFDNMPHGWTGARANYDNPENVKASQEASEILANFFKANL
ncbi:Alpha/Beta hydrolase protein [Blyttiomyces helicus]|uniref:Alpha/Beta hydrolase protein n=1 Tax=Blyttiomyces helicus TaxID=388810 RepID=A0A4P9W226_9FUNG|nr:Alpha/Beta hydrolase protein [Blyttiomyces helicus]|eukprot:RKO85425.1 Alpha/Beta hydrolase protein [Blyttiomyces helicus]